MNYAAKGDTYYGTNKLKDYNPALWSSVRQLFSKRKRRLLYDWLDHAGTCHGAGGFFSDMAALVLAPSGDLAAIEPTSAAVTPISWRITRLHDDTSEMGDTGNR